MIIKIKKLKKFINKLYEYITLTYQIEITLNEPQLCHFLSQIQLDPTIKNKVLAYNIYNDTLYKIETDNLCFCNDRQFKLSFNLWYNLHDQHTIFCTMPEKIALLYIINTVTSKDIKEKIISELKYWLPEVTYTCWIIENCDEWLNHNYLVTDLNPAFVKAIPKSVLQKFKKPFVIYYIEPFNYKLTKYLNKNIYQDYLKEIKSKKITTKIDSYLFLNNYIMIKHISNAHLQEKIE